MADLKHSLRKLIPDTRKRGRLEPANDREPIPAGQGVGTRSVAENSVIQSTGGIASPLTEQPGTRTYHTPKSVISSDGLFVIEYSHAKTLTLKDSNNESAEIYLDDV